MEIKLKSKIGKSDIDEAKNIIKQFGYWSDETKDFVSRFRFDVAQKVHMALLAYEKEIMLESKNK